MRTRRVVGLLLAVVGLAMLAGCEWSNTISSYYQERWDLTGGHMAREHPKPGGDEYYTNFDTKAATIEIEPIEDTNPVKTQHVLVATVKDAQGNTLSSRRVDWMILDGVGSIVEVDESGLYDHRGYKVDNRYAVSHTNSYPHVLTRGNADPSDDINLTHGQSWCVITSMIEGDTYIAAWCPGIFDWEKHKVFAVKHWRDIAWEYPPDATNPVGTLHHAAVKVKKGSTGAPIPGIAVTFKVASGPAAVLDPGGQPTTTVMTDGGGMAAVTLRQVTPVEGENVIDIEINRPADANSAASRISTGSFKKTWLAPKIAITKSAPPTASVGDTIEYPIQVSNPGRSAANNVVVTDTLPPGVEFVSADPQASVAGQILKWSLGTLAPNDGRSITVRVKITRTGTFENVVEVNADMGLSARAAATTVVKAGALAIEKTGPAETVCTDPVEYRIVVRNTGDGMAEHVVVTDQMQDGLTSDDGKSTLTFDLGNLEGGASKEMTYKATATKPGKLTNTAVVTGERGLRAEATHTMLHKMPSLNVKVTGPAERFMGTSGKFAITVQNTGDGVARDVQLVNMLPASAKVEEASDAGQMAEGRITWALGNIEANASRDVKFTLEFGAIGTAVNNAEATNVCSKATAQVTTDVKGIPAVLLEMVDNPDPVEVGTTTTYTITVTNQGSATDTNIQLTAILPPEEAYVSGEGATSIRGEAGNKIVFAPLPSMAPQEKAVWKVVVKAVKPGNVRFEVQMTTDQIGTKVPAVKIEATNLYR